MSFTIKKPGFFKQRDGNKAEVVGQSRDSRWVGFIGGAVWWDTEGCLYGGVCRPGDIVGEWHDIPEPPAGFVVMPRDYVAKKGDMVSSRIAIPRWEPVTAFNGWSAEEADEAYGEYGPYCIASPIPASPIPAPPKPEPGEGWRLLEDGEVIEVGDEWWDSHCDDWIPCKKYVGKVFGEFITIGGWLPHRRRIPAPFRISDKGCGIYQTRDGRQATVKHEPERWDRAPWTGLIDGVPYLMGWNDEGGNPASYDNGVDLVRFIGPLPAPEIQKFKVGDKVRTIDGHGNEHQCTVMAVPGVAHSDYLVGGGGWSAWRSPSALEEENASPETWTPTCGLQLLRMPQGYKGKVTLSARCDNGYSYAVRLEQRWTRGTEVEWRPVPVEATT